MKTTLKSFAIALVMGNANSILAQSGISVTDLEKENYMARIITVDHSNNLNIFLEKYSDEKVFIEFVDVKGYSLYKMTVPKKHIRERFKINMDALPDGDYTLVVRDRHSKAQKTFRKETEIMIAKPIVGKIEHTLVALD